MICEVCREKDADIVFKTVTGNQVATKAMCMSCAHAMQQDMIKMFMSMGMQPAQGRVEELDKEKDKEETPAVPSFICTSCERPFYQLDEQTMAGCPSCYEAMSDELARYFKKNGNLSDETPAADAAAPDAETLVSKEPDRLQALRFSLMEAVVKEDFEEAARLRDLLAQEGIL